jgi:cytochrome b
MHKVKVWDPLVRLFHWGLAALVLASFLTSDHDALVPVHVGVGIAVVGAVLSRVVWGFVGSRHARFSAFVRGPREILSYARALLRRRPPLHLSHNPLGGAMVVAFVAVLLALAATGALVRAGPEFEGPLTGILTRRGAKDLEEVHEALAGVLVGLVVAHVLGVLVSSVLERQNLVLGMITGWKRGPARPGLAKPREHLLPLAGAAAVALGLAAAIGLALVLGLPRRTHAEGPVAAGPVAAALLREYEAAARRDDPGFRGFSAAEGRRIYFQEFTADGQKVSCSACHTADPRGRGRTPVGKIVEPLAPAANPDRLTERREVEKWFKRNCKQVMGRECTAAEKGHFLAFLLAS